MTSTERMVRNHPRGTIPETLTLDTPEKRAEYEREMEAATRDQREADRRARAESWLKAKTRIVF